MVPVPTPDVPAQTAFQRRRTRGERRRLDQARERWPRKEKERVSKGRGGNRKARTEARENALRVELVLSDGDGREVEQAEDGLPVGTHWAAGCQ